MLRYLRTKRAGSVELEPERVGARRAESRVRRAGTEMNEIGLESLQGRKRIRRPKNYVHVHVPR